MAEIIEMTEETEATRESLQLASEIQARIANLESLFEMPLRDEMEALKVCLVSNPNAAALLKDEDVGLLVKNLRRTVSAAIVEANKPKERKTAKPKAKAFTAEEMQKALDEEGFPS